MRDLCDCYALSLDAMTWRRLDAGGAGGLPGPAPRSAHALVATASGGLLVVGGVQDGALADASPMVLDNAAAVEGRTLRNQAAAALAAAAEADAARRRAASGAAVAAVEAGAARRDAMHARAEAEEAAAARAAAAEAQRQMATRLGQERTARLRAVLAARNATSEAAALRTELARRTAALEAAVRAADADVEIRADVLAARDAARAAVANDMDALRHERDAYAREARVASASAAAALASRVEAEMRLREAERSRAALQLALAEARDSAERAELAADAIAHRATASLTSDETPRPRSRASNATDD